MKMKFVFSLTSIFICLAGASSATAGWGSSGGGEIIKDTLNPWWLRNVKEVTYCINVDAESISISSDKIPALIETAIQYWKKEFSREFPFLDSSYLLNKAGVATQSFKLTNCNESVDLKILFGYGTLSEQQKKNLPDLNRFVGVVIRTEYDEVSMKGKGFIYIASDRGPHKYLGADDLVDQPWSHKKVLTQILMHEFGHLFGVPHSDRMGGLMNYLFPEMSLRKEMVASSEYINFDEYPSQFVPPTRFFGCIGGPNGMVEKYQKFFGFHSSAQCLDYRMNLEKNEIEVFLRQSSEKPNPGDVQIGSITGLKWQLSDLLSVSGFVLVYLDSKQNVFTSNEMSGSPFPYVVAQVYLDLTGTQGIYRSIGGADVKVEQPVMMKLSPTSHHIYGFIDGKIDELYGFINTLPNQ